MYYALSTAKVGRGLDFQWTSEVPGATCMYVCTLLDRGHPLCPLYPPKLDSKGSMMGVGGQRDARANTFGLPTTIGVLVSNVMKNVE